MSYELNEKKLTTANKKLLKDLHASLGIDKSVLSNNQLLQKISQAFFSKPFEEVQKTIFNEVSNVYENLVPRVFLLDYGSENILVVDGDFESATYNGSDQQVDFNQIYDEAKCLAKRMNSKLKQVSLPSVLSDDWQYDDVIKLAEKMGYFKYDKTFFDIIEETNVRRFIDGEHTNFSLDGDWESQLDDYDDYGDVIIWSPEIGTNKDLSYKEYFFTFEDICSAKLKNDGSWVLMDGSTKEKYLITFAYMK